MASYTHRHVARFTLEAVTPLSIGTGQGAGLFDTALTRDANGLPTIPGTALAGVLSSLHRAYFPGSTNQWRDLFGYEEERSRQSHGDKGKASRLEFSFGCIHDQHDKAVEALRFGALSSDPLLELAARPAPLKRDHVKINHRGVVEGKQKFDRVSLPPGYRFSFEVAMWGEAERLDADKAALLQVLGLLNAPDFRLGGASRRGLGKLSLVEANTKTPGVSYAVFDMRNGVDRKKFAQYRGVPIDEASAPLGFMRSPVIEPEAESAGRKVHSFALRLKAVDFWRFGDGDLQLSEGGDAHGADSVPLLETRVTYENGKGRLLEEKRKRRLAIPGSAVKGPLAHRAEFHLNCAEDKFANAPAPDELPRGMDLVFGSAKTSTKKNGADSGIAGLLLIDDAYVDLGDYGPKPMLITHNTIDRFSGGVMNQRLFAEEALYGGELVIKLTVQGGRPQKSKNGETQWDLVAPKYWEALDKALADLCQGRLALGADGHGYFELAPGGQTPSLSAELGARS